jgi:hypothetical protein
VTAPPTTAATTISHQGGRPVETTRVLSGTPASCTTPLVTASPYRAVIDL